MAIALAVNCDSKIRNLKLQTYQRFSPAKAEELLVEVEASSA